MKPSSIVEKSPTNTNMLKSTRLIDEAEEDIKLSTLSSITLLALVQGSDYHK
jgi:hypothetical protein